MLEVTSLKHELRDDAVEDRSRVTKAVLASCELAEVFGGLRYYIVVKLEDDATCMLFIDGDIELQVPNQSLCQGQAANRSMSR